MRTIQSSAVVLYPQSAMHTSISILTPPFAHHSRTRETHGYHRCARTIVRLRNINPRAMDEIRSNTIALHGDLTPTMSDLCIATHIEVFGRLEILRNNGGDNTRSISFQTMRWESCFCEIWIFVLLSYRKQIIATTEMETNAFADTPDTHKTKLRNECP